MNEDVLNVVCGALVTVHVGPHTLRGIATSIGKGDDWLGLIDEGGGDDVPFAIIPLARIDYIETEC